MYVSMPQRDISSGALTFVSEMRELVYLHDPESHVSRRFSFCSEMRGLVCLHDPDSHVSRRSSFC